MFDALKKKYMATLLFAIAAFLLIFFIFSGVYTLRLLENDALEKASQLENQYSKSVEFRLSELEENCMFLLRDESLKNALISNNQSYISNALYDTETSNDSISGMCIITADGSCCTSDSFYSEFPSFLFGKEYLHYLKENIFLKSWSIPEISEENLSGRFSNHPLVFITPIREKYKIIGWLILHAEQKKLCADFDLENNIFLSKTSISLSDGHASVSLISEKKPIYAKEIKRPLDKYDNLTVDFISPKIIITSEFKITVIIWVVMFILFILFGIQWIKAYINSIVSPLETLYFQMGKYIESKKNNRTAKESNKE